MSTAEDARFRRESERRLDADAAEISMAASNDRPNTATAALRTPENADLRDAELVLGKPQRKAVGRLTPVTAILRICIFLSPQKTAAAILSR